MCEDIGAKTIVYFQVHPRTSLVFLAGNFLAGALPSTLPSIPLLPCPQQQQPAHRRSRAAPWPARMHASACTASRPARCAAPPAAAAAASAARRRAAARPPAAAGPAAAPPAMGAGQSINHKGSDVQSCVIATLPSLARKCMCNRASPHALALLSQSLRVGEGTHRSAQHSSPGQLPVGRWVHGGPWRQQGCRAAMAGHWRV